MGGDVGLGMQGDPGAWGDQVCESRGRNGESNQKIGRIAVAAVTGWGTPVLAEVSVAWVFKAIDMTCISLDVAVSEIFLVSGIPVKVRRRHPIGSSLSDIMDAMFCIVVYHHGNAIDAQVVRQVVIVLRVVEGIDHRLEVRDHVCVIGRCHGAKEYVRPISGRVVDALLSL